MEIYKTKGFARFARKEKISDDALCQAIERAELGLVEAELGGGLIKQRVARPGEGRSGGFRTLIAFRSSDFSIFLYGFAKSEQENVTEKEIQGWKLLATEMLEFSPDELSEYVEAGRLIEVACDE